MQHANKHTPHIHTSYLLIYQINSTVAEQSTNWVEKLRAEQSTNWALKQSRGKGTCLHVMQIEHQSSRAPREQPRLDQRLGAERRRWGFHVQASDRPLSFPPSLFPSRSESKPATESLAVASIGALPHAQALLFPTHDSRARASLPRAPFFSCGPRVPPRQISRAPSPNRLSAPALLQSGCQARLVDDWRRHMQKNSWRPGRHKNFTAWMTRRRHKNHGMR